MQTCASQPGRMWTVSVDKSCFPQAFAHNFFEPWISGWRSAYWHAPISATPYLLFDCAPHAITAYFVRATQDLDGRTQRLSSAGVQWTSFSSRPLFPDHDYPLL